MKQKSTKEIRASRMETLAIRGCSNLAIAMPWPKFKSNVGTLVRVADATQSCVYLPHETARVVFRRGSGNTIGRQESGHLIHWEDEPNLTEWDRTIAVELAHGAISLPNLRPADPSEKTLVIVGHETTGVPETYLHGVDEIVEIPMAGVSPCLNVVTSATLVLYKLRNWV